MPVKQCPSRDQFVAMTQGKLPAATVEELAAHVESCPGCAQTVSELANDTLVDALRAGAPASDTTDDIRIQAIIERHRTMLSSEHTGTISKSDEDSHPPVPSDATEADEPIDFLSPPQSPNELGRLGGYRILRTLGAGGMGIVFEAEDIKLERRVALKVMKREVARKPEHRERFLREARTAAKVESDHICPIYQVGEEDGIPFIAMPFLKGEPLDARLRTAGMNPAARLEIADIIRIGREIAEGLSAAHAAGLVHRDIKPGNIWLESVVNRDAIAERVGRIRILDFGLARIAQENANLTKSGTIMGTPAYMAPEQARAKPVDHRADLFSLGCVLYEMTTGKRPFSGPDTMAILSSLALDTPAAPHELNPQTPAPLSALILQLLEKEPTKRVQSAAEVVRTLAALEPQSCLTNFVADPWKDIDVTKPVGTPTGARSASKGEAQEHLLAPRAHRSRLRRSALIALSALVAATLVFGAYQLFFKTTNGTLIVQVDKDADVRFKNGKLQIYDETGKVLKYELEPSEKNKTLPPGKYLVKVTGPDGLKLETPEFTMEKNGKATVRVMVDQAAAAKAKPGGSATGERDPDRRAAEWVLSIGGKVTIRVAEKRQEVGATQNLPAQPFQVVAFELSGNPRVSDGGMEHLKGLTNLTYLELFNTPVSDAGLVHLKGLTNLKVLRLDGTQVSNGGLEHLKGMTSLTTLYLDGKQVSNAGIAHLKGLANLQNLTLNVTQMSDAGLAHLKGLTNLELLDLRNTQVSDAGLKYIEGLTKLTTLYAANTQVSDAGLAHLKGLTNLTILTLHNTRVSGAGLTHLKRLTNLVRLHLGETPVTDAGLDQLSGMKQLTLLDLKQTKVTAAGVTKLAAALPLCTIESDHGTFGPGPWIPLFDGKDLSAWTEQGEKGWTVRDGVLYASAVMKDAAGGSLITKQQFQDYELELEIRTPATRKIMPVVDKIGPKSDWNVVFAPTGMVEAAQGDWHKLRVVEVGNRLTMHLKGVEIATHSYAGGNRGYLGLRLVQVATEYRNIRVRELATGGDVKK